MVIFLADGRLGNQIFQYVFLKTIQTNNEQIIVSGFEDLLEVFEINDIVKINKKNRWIRFFLSRLCKPILTSLSDKKIISSISVKREDILNIYKRESTAYDYKKGIINKITFIKLGFFQSEQFFNKDIATQLKLKEKFLQNASFFLKNIPINSHKIFIHIRRADYKEYKVYGKTTLLPKSYYKKRIEWFKHHKKKCFFIFLSDDPEFIKKEFLFVSNKLISNKNHFGTDLAIMSQCNSAILSPSSFGWWGSYLMKERDTVFVNKYWLGFKSKMEYQKSGTPSYSIEVEI